MSDSHPHNPQPGRPSRPATSRTGRSTPPPPPPPPTSDAPAQTSPAPKQSSASLVDAHRRTLAKDISAYPASITYQALIAKNKRASVVLIALMILLGVTIGAFIAGALAPYTQGLFDSTSAYASLYEPERYDLTHQSSASRDATYERDISRVTRAPVRVLGADTSVYADLSILLPSAALGGSIALLIATAGATWSWFRGSSAILRMLGAKCIVPELDAELFNVVDEVRIAAGLPMPAIYLIPETAMNAFATGRDPNHAAVAITTGLRSKLTRAELQAVMAHEVAHIRHYDIRFAMLMATMVGLIVFACDAFLRIALHSGRHSAYRSRRRDSKGSGGVAIVLIILALILAIVAPLLARIIQMAYSRQREYLADAGAVELTRDPESLASALARLATDPEPTVELANRGTAHMFIVNPLKKMHAAKQSLNSVFSSHPPMPQRIARILALTR